VSSIIIVSCYSDVICSLLCIILLMLPGIMTFSSVQSTPSRLLSSMNLITGKTLGIGILLLGGCVVSSCNVL